MILAAEISELSFNFYNCQKSLENSKIGLEQVKDNETGFDICIKIIFIFDNIL